MRNRRAKATDRKVRGVRKSKTATLPKYKQMIADCRECIIDGCMLAVDPSTGSTSSMPGYAVFKNGELIESGTITVDLKGNRAERLFEINRTLREDFKEYTFDVIAVESAGYFIGKMNPASIISLQRAIGAIIAAFPVKCLVEVPSNVWQKHKFKGYVKGDEQDAICIGLCVLNTAIALKKTAA